jgi:small ligand-binding sensory domain FIST
VALGGVVTPGGTLAIGLTGVKIAAGHSFSLRPLGTAHKITAARGERILELDGQPAREVVAAEVGEAADAFVRTTSVSAVNLAGDALIAPGAAEGAIATFLVRDGEGARANLDALLARLAAETAAHAPVFGLYFNCAARGQDLYGAADVDVSLIRARFPGLPVAGLFGSFELAPVAGAAAMHAYTGVLVLVSEA